MKDSTERNISRQQGRATHPLLWTLAVIVGIGVVVAGYVVFGPRAMDFAGGRKVALTDYRQGDPTGVPAELKAASVVERGEYLTRAADCLVCHTAKDGAPFAGGRAFVLPFGVLYSTNITPDGPTGIGSYSLADFDVAVRRGVAKDGHRLYPAMPFPSYAKLSDDDVRKLYGFFMHTVSPAQQPNRAPEIAFPLNQRWLLAFWDVLFAPEGTYQAKPDHDEAWNRGAYLVQVHCSMVGTHRICAPIPRSASVAGRKRTS